MHGKNIKENKMNLPENPILLMSFVNTKLRDEYDDIDSLCEDLGIKKAELVNKLESAGFSYIKEINQFR